MFFPFLRLLSVFHFLTLCAITQMQKKKKNIDPIKSPYIWTQTYTRTHTCTHLHQNTYKTTLNKPIQHFTQTIYSKHHGVFRLLPSCFVVTLSIRFTRTAAHTYLTKPCQYFSVHVIRFFSFCLSSRFALSFILFSLAPRCLGLCQMCSSPKQFA